MGSIERRMKNVDGMCAQNDNTELSSHNQRAV